MPFQPDAFIRLNSFLFWLVCSAENTKLFIIPVCLLHLAYIFIQAGKVRADALYYRGFLIVNYLMRFRTEIP